MCHANPLEVLKHGRMISYVLLLLMLCKEWTLGTGREVSRVETERQVGRLWQQATQGDNSILDEDNRREGGNGVYLGTETTELATGVCGR